MPELCCTLSRRSAAFDVPTIWNGLWAPLHSFHWSPHSLLLLILIYSTFRFFSHSKLAFLTSNMMLAFPTRSVQCIGGGSHALFGNDEMTLNCHIILYDTMAIQLKVFWSNTFLLFFHSLSLIFVFTCKDC